MLLAAAFFAGMDATLKLFAGHYPPLEVTALRGAASIPFVLLSVAWSGRWRDLRPVRWRMHLLRATLGLGMIVTFILAVRDLTLVNAYAVFLVAPLLIAALAVPILGETVDARRWIAIFIGLAGVLVMLRPSAAGFVSYGAIAALISALLYAFTALSSRVLLRSDSTVSLVMSFLVCITVVAGALAASNWVAIRPEHWALIAAMGLLGALGQHFIIDAFRHAPASVLAPFEYTALVWGATIDWFAWGTLPTVNVIVGGGIVVITGIYLVRRERQPVPTLPASS
jgi:drug/metabolite transporter (DMT)-like permease